MERAVLFLADANGPYKRLLAAEQTAQSLQACIEVKNDAIRTIRQQALDQGFPENVINGDIKQLMEDIGRFKQLLDRNEASRYHWREMHMAAWRATVRPLKVVDMPNEILTNIFANFEDGRDPQLQVDSSSLDHPLPSPDVASIKSIRLTSRAFCEVASEILLPVVNVSFTRSSLQRLEDISSHPTLSKSVRVLRVHANPYNPALAMNKPYDYFLAETTRELCGLYNGFVNDLWKIEKELAAVARSDGMTLQSQMLRSRKLEIVDIKLALAEARPVTQALIKLRLKLQSEISLDPFLDYINKAIDEAREECGRRFLEQQSLMNNPHVLTNIVNAVTHMPNVQKLCIPDEGSHHWDNIFRSGRDKRYDAKKYAAAMTAANPFWDLMVHGGFRDESLDSPDEEPLLPLLHKLPLVLQVPNENLTHIDINLPPLGNHDMEILTENLTNLRNSFRCLKSVQITILET